MAARDLLGLGVADRRPLDADPARDRPGRTASSGSTSVVLPAPAWPTRATLRTLDVDVLGLVPPALVGGGLASASLAAGGAKRNRVERGQAVGIRGAYRDGAGALGVSSTTRLQRGSAAKEADGAGVPNRAGCTGEGEPLGAAARPTEAMFDGALAQRGRSS